MANTEIDARQHTLYRFYDVAERLLYVGITANPGRRFGQHGADKPWWTEVVSIRLEIHPDRAAVLAAERDAIAREHPAYNIQHANTAAPTSCASSPDRRDVLSVGDVVALGLSDGACPVGLVVEVNRFGPTIALLKWLTGHFDTDTAIPWSRIREIRWATKMSPAAATAAGYNTAGPIWDCDKLGDFQASWKCGPQVLAG